jgi:hypothetical protein
LGAFGGCEGVGDRGAGTECERSDGCDREDLERFHCFLLVAVQKHWLLVLLSYTARRN